MTMHQRHHQQQQMHHQMMQQGAPPELPRKEFSIMEKMNSLRRFINPRPLPPTPAQQAAHQMQGGYQSQGRYMYSVVVMFYYYMS
jgi:hypothetical protein